MGVFKAKEVNSAFKEFVPELAGVPEAAYPFQHERWLGFNEEYEGQPTFVASKTNDGVKPGYVYCKNAPKGPGYYHVLCKCSYVNLYARLMSEGSPSTCCKPDAKAADRWDTARRVIYARSRCSRPDDGAAAEQQVDHMVGTALNPVHGLKA